jgi:serine/threonine protein kinase
MKDIVKGCLYLNKKGILHRDLKPENIFLNKASVKIADFGFAVEQENKQLIGFNVGSPLYMPY